MENNQNTFSETTVRALGWIINLLDQKKIPHQISGGFAAKIYGSARPLNDIDVDIPEENFDDILDEIKEHIVYGPTRHIDGKWDCDLITLNYHGQEIDICGAQTTKVSNKERTTWIPTPVDFTKTKPHQIEGIEIRVISPEDLSAYKQHLDGDHQLVDIEAARNYLEKSD